MKRTRKIKVIDALKALRRMASRNKTDADAIIVVRGRLDTEGKWEVDWEAAHWMPDLDPTCIASSGLPVGFGPAAAQEIASVSAGDVAEERFGRFGAAVGKGLWEALSTRLSETDKDEDHHGR